MSDKPISDLRRRMIADMTIRTFSDKTQHDYIRHVEAFARFLGRSPDTATGDDIRRFLCSGPASHSTLRSNPIGCAGRRHYPSAATRRLRPNLIVAIKSP